MEYQAVYSGPSLIRSATALTITFPCTSFPQKQKQQMYMAEASPISSRSRSRSNSEGQNSRKKKRNSSSSNGKGGGKNKGDGKDDGKDHSDGKGNGNGKDPADVVGMQGDWELPLIAPDPRCPAWLHAKWAVEQLHRQSSGQDKGDGTDKNELALIAFYGIQPPRTSSLGSFVPKTPPLSDRTQARAYSPPVDNCTGKDTESGKDTEGEAEKKSKASSSEGGEAEKKSKASGSDGGKADKKS